MLFDSQNFVQVTELFPSSRGLEVTWSSVVKIAQSLYREAPGKDPFRPDQKTPVKNFFLAGSYTKQVTNSFTLKQNVQAEIHKQSQISYVFWTLLAGLHR